MSETQHAAPPPPTPRRGSFLGRLITGLLFVVMTTALALAVVLAAFFRLGFTVDTPLRLAEAQQQLATAQAQNQALEGQTLLLQTQVADLDRRVSGGRETLDELRGQVAEMGGLADRLAENDARNATVVAEARASRDAVALFATAEADRALLLVQLRQRSDRMERFIQRLGDISQDTASDLQGAPLGPTSLATPAPTASATPLPAATPPPTTTPVPTVLATAASTATAPASATSSPIATAEASATPSATARASTTPSATRTPTATPLPGR
ncbi:MAG TPA: hypothetical protein VFS21_40005 [Roseiflexaceae bacterium]|nr:hypothetical protein [Roseiflexaceae bacterium]